MAEDNYHDFSWFNGMPPDDQVSLLADPSQPLSKVMNYRLDHSPRLWWATKGPGARLLSAEGVASLDALRAQLDYWWENHLDAADRDYITQRRNDDLDGSYAKKLKAANETEFGGPPTKLFVVVKDSKTKSFRLPLEIRTYVGVAFRR